MQTLLGVFQLLPCTYSTRQEVRSIAVEDVKDGHCCHVSLSIRRHQRRTVLSGVLDQQTTERWTVLSGVLDQQMTERRTVLSGVWDQQMTERRTVLSGVSDQQTTERRTVLSGVSDQQTTERRTVLSGRLDQQMTERRTVLSGVCGWCAAWGRDSWCVWHAPCSAKPRSLCWTRPQLPLTWRLTTSFSRPSGPSSRTALCSPLRTGSTPSWIMTGTGEGEGRGFFGGTHNIYTSLQSYIVYKHHFSHT